MSTPRDLKPGEALPKAARVVIVGGGVIGCSVAYHLIQAGWRDVLLLERHKLTAGTTWHAAGLVVTSGFTSETSIELARYTRDLYARLEQETGVATGFDPVGLLQVATTPGILEDLRRKAAFNRLMGIESVELSRAEVAARWPLAKTDDVLAGFLTQADGRANPVDATMSLARGARAGGARIVEGVAVTDVLRRGDRVAGVITERGEIEAEVVVNCAGMWARELARRAGVCVPLQAVEHYYLILDVPGVGRRWPVLEDPSRYAYLREESGGLMLGIFEPVAAPWSLDAIPEKFSFGVLEPDVDRMAPFVEAALERVPVARDAPVRQFFCGPESFTPDLSPVVGEAPELRNFFVAAGLNSLGILTGGGIGRLVARWIIDGLPDMDVCELHIDRFQPFQANRAFRADRSVEIVGEIYKVHYPNRSYESARNARRHVLHERLAAAGARFALSAGWEIASWYAPPELRAEPERHGWGRQASFAHVAEEHRACREGVILMDMSFMSKFVVQGRDAQAFLGRLSCNDLDVPPGRIVYTQWVNERGGIEADLTIARRAEDEFFVVCSDTAHRHVETWMRRHLPADARVAIHDATGSWAMLSLQGPRSRELLSRLTPDPLATQDFPYLAAREIEIGYSRVHAVRITYLGELGYELYVPTEHALDVHDRLLAAGGGFGLRYAGLLALTSLRMEKAYRDWGHDIDNIDTPFEAGLGFAVKLDKRGGFIGRDALARRKAEGLPRRRLLQFALDDPEPLLHHGEVIWRDGERVGYVRVGAWGFTLGAAVGLGMVEAGKPVDRSYVESGRWEIEIAGKRHPARASLQPLYDPRLVRVKV